MNAPSKDSDITPTKAIQSILEKTLGERLLHGNYESQWQIEVPSCDIKLVAQALRDTPGLNFDMLIDVCGVDYLHYGQYEWSTHETSVTGFGRGVDAIEQASSQPRFGVVYHLLSVKLNQRLRVKTLMEGEPPMLDSVCEIWPVANWFEREAYDLYGIVFKDHPDLRRILTDYGFIGHPFRKDFPVSGHVEMRYDAKLGRVIYQPVEIEPRVLVPKVFRDDNRYQMKKTEAVEK